MYILIAQFAKINNNTEQQLWGIINNTSNVDGADREFATTIRERKLQYFGHMIRAQNLCTYILKVD